MMCAGGFEYKSIRLILQIKVFDNGSNACIIIVTMAYV